MSGQAGSLARHELNDTGKGKKVMPGFLPEPWQLEEGGKGIVPSPSCRLFSKSQEGRHVQGSS